MLLGQSALQKLKKYIIDYEKMVIIFEDSSKDIINSSQKKVTNTLNYSHKGLTANEWYEKANELIDNEVHNESNTAKTIECLSNAIMLDPDFFMAYAVRAMVYAKQSKHQKAIEDYSEAIRLKPGWEILYNYRGNVYYLLSQYQHAIKDYDEAIRLKPDYRVAYINRGIVHSLQKNKILACHDFQKACDLGDCENMEEAKSAGHCH